MIIMDTQKITTMLEAGGWTTDQARTLAFCISEQIVMSYSGLAKSEEIAKLEAKLEAKIDAASVTQLKWTAGLVAGLAGTIIAAAFGIATLVLRTKMGG